MASVFLLRLFRLVFLGQVRLPAGTEKEMSKDLDLREMILIAPLIALVFILGIKPGLLLDTFPRTIAEIARFAE